MVNFFKLINSVLKPISRSKFNHTDYYFKFSSLDYMLLFFLTRVKFRVNEKLFIFLFINFCFMYVFKIRKKNFNLYIL